jgi:glycosyltransferase involved in cell wall biosynthesis
LVWSAPDGGRISHQAFSAVRILLVSQMYPGPAEPDYGVFVRDLADAVERRGHELDRVVVDRRGGGLGKYVHLARGAARSRRTFRPDVVWAHFLFPTGLVALAARAPLVVTAHGRDVRNVGEIRGVRAATRFVVKRAGAVIAVSKYLRHELESRIPEARGRIHVVDSGVDLQRFQPQDAAPARAELGWEGEGPAFLCVGRLDERKNVLRLASAFERLGQGRLAFVGDGPLRAELEGRPGIRVVGPVPHDRIPRWLAACDVLCQPSLVEPFGQANLEAMAAGRTVVASRVGGPPEFVPPEAGVLVDPLDEDGLVEALRLAAGFPSPNPAARAAAAEHDVNRQGERVDAILQRAARLGR